MPDPLKINTGELAMVRAMGPAPAKYLRQKIANFVVRFDALPTSVELTASTALGRKPRNDADTAKLNAQTEADTAELAAAFAAALAFYRGEGGDKNGG